ncbi:MAG TPA: hypothetical protein VLQ80_32955 [Candidatus Saccharimonadia bacterium]|nr:hypothetical protein [Candidatus Saccharimonadia bacterium]
MLGVVVGPRSSATAKEVVAATKVRMAGIPVFFSDGFTCYLVALIAAFHVVTTCVRTTGIACLATCIIAVVRSTEPFAPPPI